MTAYLRPLPDAYSDDDLWMTECQFQSRVLRLLKRLGLLWHHDHVWSQSMPGFPDLVIVGPNGVLWWELKTTLGTLTPEQQHWGDLLKAAGARYSVMTPQQWVDGTIERALRALAEGGDISLPFAA